MAFVYRRLLKLKRVRVVFQNPDDRAVFINDNILPAEQTSVILGSGVDTTLFNATPEPVGIPVVVLASRMLWDKGIAQFVQAAETLKKEGVRARFVLVGGYDGDNPTAIPEATLQEWNRQGFVEWWGQRKDMPKILANCHIVCLPSFREGIPRILIEAAAPCHALRQGGELGAVDARFDVRA